MGESGSGKSTLLKAVYGLLNLTNGSIFWKDHQVLGPEHHLVPGMDFFKYVAQDFDLMPYTTVAENIAKFLSRFYLEEAETRVRELLEVIEMTEFADIKVKNLSGGQQQRVAIARALAKEPELILLDEPFSQIDNFKKNSLRRKLFAFLKEKNIACIVATHDGNDALSFADKMTVIKDNSILSQASPRELYSNPKHLYIASLFDDVNQIDGKLYYPHQINIEESSDSNAIVKQSYYKGSFWLIEVVFNGRSIFVKYRKELKNDSKVRLSFL